MNQKVIDDKIILPLSSSLIIFITNAYHFLKNLRQEERKKIKKKKKRKEQQAQKKRIQ